MRILDWLFYTFYCFTLDRGSRFERANALWSAFSDSVTPALGRWHVADPMAEMAPGLTPYRYAFNNPISVTDPTGMYEYTDGYQRHDSKTSTGAVSHSGYLSESSGGLGGGGDEGESEGGNLEWQKSTMTGENGEEVIIDVDYRGDGPGDEGGDGNGAQSGTCCGNDWFGTLGAFFERNYNGGIVYDGKAWYGTNFVGPGPTENPYKLEDPKNPGQYLKPKDMIDAAAQRHDYYYYKFGADGVSAALLNDNIEFADQILVNEAYKAVTGYFRGGTDPITGNAISPRTRDVALDILVSFGIIVSLK